MCVCVKMAETGPLICDENLAQNWTEFHRSFVAWRITYKDDQLTGRQFSGTVQEVEQAEERLNQVLYRAAVGQFVSCLGGQGRELFFTLFPYRMIRIWRTTSKSWTSRMWYANLRGTASANAMK